MREQRRIVSYLRARPTCRGKLDQFDGRSVAALVRKGAIRKLGVWHELIDVDKAPGGPQKKKRKKVGRFNRLAQDTVKGGGKYATLAEVKEVLDWTLATLGVEESLGNKVEYSFSPRMTHTMGYAYSERYVPRKRKRRHLVRFSSQLWERASERERYETIIHEVCHIVANHLYAGEKIKPHGRKWKSLMERCGLQPEIYHHVNTKDLAPRSSCSQQSDESL